MASSDQPFVLLSTVPTRSEAKKIASLLVKNKFAACVNIIPAVESLFIWKGKLDLAKELLLVIKTTKKKLREVERAVRKHHSYEVPELIAFPVTFGHGAYLKWLRDSVG